MASLMGGMCLQKALGGAHAMATPLGELHLHHGTLIGILLPHILRFNKGYADAAYANLAAAMNIPDGIDLHMWMTGFVTEIGLPTTLSALSVDEALLPAIAEKASLDHLSATNPRPAAAADYLQLLRDAM